MSENIDISKPALMRGGEGPHAYPCTGERQPSGVCCCHIGDAICYLLGVRRRVTLGFLTGSEQQRQQISE